MFGKLISDLKGAGATIGRLFGASDSKRYPNTIGETSIDRITNQPKYNNGDWRSSRGYEFSVGLYNKATNQSAGEAPGWTDFRLQINPQDLTQDEIFAIQVTPTFRGVIVEHQGVTIKDLTISGTTGLSPMRKEGGALLNSGAPVFALGTSGFEEFHELRSYFRAYVEAKRQESKGGDSELRLVFKNLKDNEFLFVEPQKFTLKRSAARPFLYDYVINMKAIGVATPSSQNRSLWESLDDALEQVQGYFNLSTQVINGGFGIISRFQRDIASTLLGPLQAINSAIVAVRGGVATNFGPYGITRRTVSDLKREFEKVEANFSDILGRDNAAYNSAVGRTPTLQGNPNRISTYQELQILNGLQAGKKGCTILMSQLEVFEPNVFETNAQVLALYPNSGVKAPNSVSTSTIQGGDNIQMVALRELGDMDRFRDIVILNNLRPPYISETGGPGVLKIGDKILIPKPNPAGNSAVAKNVQWNITKNMKQAEVDLGVDIKLTEEGDFAIGSNKDLDLIAGVENFMQAIAVRIFLEKSSLKRHPYIGTYLQIGTKSRANKLIEIRKQILDSLGGDTRVESIPFIELKQEGGTININMMVKIKEIQQPVPLPLTINVG